MSEGTDFHFDPCDQCGDILCQYAEGPFCPHGLIEAEDDCEWPELGDIRREVHDAN